MSADGHGWVCMGVNEYIGAGEHKKETRRVMDGHTQAHAGQAKVAPGIDTSFWHA